MNEYTILHTDISAASQKHADQTKYTKVLKKYRFRLRVKISKHAEPHISLKITIRIIGMHKSTQKEYYIHSTKIEERYNKRKTVNYIHII